MSLDTALELLRHEKPSRRSASRKVLRELGPHPESGATVQLLEGRYGPYVTDGDTNASLPKDVTSDAVTLDTAIELLRARSDAKPRAGRRSTGARGGGRGAGRTSSRRRST